MTELMRQEPPNHESGEEAVRVLIADDERAFLKALATYLAAPHREILTARDGNEALELLESFSVDVVVTDLVMPGVDGLEVLRRARARCDLILVILMTGYGSLDTAVRAMREGAFDYKAKPFLLEEMGLSVAKAETYLRLLRERDLLLRQRDALLKEIEELRVGENTEAAPLELPAPRRPVLGVLGRSTSPDEASSWYRRWQPEGSLEEELEVLRKLRDQGLLTQEQWRRLESRLVTVSG